MIRQAVRGDEEIILGFIKGLTKYENMELGLCQIGQFTGLQGKS